ncbi:hypothetical protein [Kistimonas asteriae]|uniref:hypothetical protein n=1 Tax=Kistimonas asteriae TaxID=517724 RepID=UPI001BA9D1AB|nr:hypothetical protein [Kistimonas asteriae]
MTDTIESVLMQITAQIEDSSIKEQLGNALITSIRMQQVAIEQLLIARKNGEITEEDFEIELTREKQITVAEMLTSQIIAKAEVQRVVNKTFQALANVLV